MQRMMQTLLERRGLAAWVKDRILRLLNDGASVRVARGYVDYVYEQELDYVSVVGDVLAADHYREGHDLAAYKLGDLTMSIEEEEQEELAA